MISLVRHVRGLGIAIAVLGISAGAVFAGVVPSVMSPVSSNSNFTADKSHSPDPSETPEASETPEPSDSASPSDSLTPSVSPAAAESPNPDTHGALVSTAAQMPTPSGFPNHGAFVSCVAHLGTTLATIDWTTVTPASCGVTPGSSVNPSANGATHGDAGRAMGQANRAAHAPSH